jgi:hypothetical protein
MACWQKMQVKKREICISGIATIRKHSLPTQRKNREEKRYVFIRILVSYKTPQTINEKENPWGYRLGTKVTLGNRNQFWSHVMS